MPLPPRTNTPRRHCAHGMVSPLPLLQGGPPWGQGDLQTTSDLRPLQLLNAATNKVQTDTMDLCSNNLFCIN